jgi:hypothetical protein
MNKNILLLCLLVLCSFAGKAQVDTSIGIKAPGSATKNYEELTHYLCDGLTGEREKANAIYNWITHNIKYDVKSLKKQSFTHPKADKVLKGRRALCEGYSTLFVEMCKEAGMKAVAVDGYAKDWIFDNGDKMYIPRHEWCAVMVDGQWELADPTWGAGGLVQAPTKMGVILNKVLRRKMTYTKKLKFQFKYDTSYFLQDPAVFKLKHLPTDPLWQLSDTAMPLQVFERGDSAVKKFNTISKVSNKNPELAKISDLTEQERTMDMADRAYEFNKRYPMALAQKYAFKASAKLEKAFTDSTMLESKALVKDASYSLKKSEEYIKEQKKDFPEQYNGLKKKNKTKNQEAKKDIRQIKTDDKRLMAEEKKYAHATKSKNDKLGKKAQAVRKRERAVDPNYIESVVTGKTEKKANSPEVMTLRDSIAARKERIKDLQTAILDQDDKIKTLEDENSKRLDSLANYLGMADSVLVLETKSRLRMNDNYDDEVITYGAQFKELKYNRADTLQKYYCANFDSIAVAHDNRQKIQIAQMDLYKKNLKAMEQYKKWNSTNENLKTDYKEAATEYLDHIATYNDDLAHYAGYLKANKKLFDGLAKVDKREIMLTDYMEKAENMRKVLEERTLAQKQSLDVNENKKQTATVAKIKRQVDSVVDKMN